MPRKTVPLFALAALAAGPLFAPRAAALGPQEKPAGQPKPPRLLAARPLSTTGQSDKLRRLVRERYNAALEEARERYRQMREVPKFDPDKAFSAFRRLLAAGVLAADTGRDRIQFLEAYLELARGFEKVLEKISGAGAEMAAERAHARYMRIDAELQLLRARRDLSGPKGAGGK
jgi:hypothetical protein